MKKKEVLLVCVCTKTKLCSQGNYKSMYFFDSGYWESVGS